MKCSLSEIEGLSAEIENLRTFGPEELDQTWRDLFGSDRPPRVCGGPFFTQLMRESRKLRTRWRSKRDLNSRPLFIKYPAECAVFSAQFRRILAIREFVRQ